MKYLLLALFVLSGCTQYRDRNKLYPCTFFNFHGSYAKASVWAPSLELAEREAEKVRDRLVSEKAIPENAGVHCEIPEPNRESK